MATTVRTVATFHSDAFNLKESKDHFINPCCFGHDLAVWIRKELRERGADIKAVSIGQEDFGWYLNYGISGEQYCLVIGNFAGESWFVVVERDTGFLASLVGAPNRNVGEAGVSAVHGVLTEAPEIRNLSWHSYRNFSKGKFGDGSPHYTG